MQVVAAVTTKVALNRSIVRPVCRRQVTAMASLDVYVKGDPVTSTLGDCTCADALAAHLLSCSKHFRAPATRVHNLLLIHAGPFSHRVLITAEQKHVPYTKHYIDVAKPPDW
jgi:hypothetical protein